MRDDYKEYLNQLNAEEQEMIKRFYKEYYQGDFRKGQVPLITDPEMKAEAIRNHNMKQTDIMECGQNVGEVSEYHTFMQDASDEWEWQDFFKVFGIEAALQVITIQTLNELLNREIDPNVTLNRYYQKRRELSKLVNREKRNVKSK